MLSLDNSSGWADRIGNVPVSLGSLTRVRSNPFWPLIDRMIGDLEGEVANSRATPSAAAKAMMEAFLKNR